MDKVIVESRRILADRPDDLNATHLLGRALTDTRQFNEAVPYLEKTRDAPEGPAWMKAWSLGYLGVCYYTTDRFEDARAALRAAVSLRATKTATNYALKRLARFQMTELYDDWTIRETAHFRFHFQSKTSPEDPDAFCRGREAAYEEINRFFQAQPSKKIDFFVWSDPDSGQKTLNKPVGFADADLCSINSRVNQTRGHEITHILCDHGIRPETKNRLINEGIAVAFDQTDTDRLAAAERIFKPEYTIRHLMENGAEYPEEIIYPIGGALLDYLKQLDEGKLKLLLKIQTLENLIGLYGEEILAGFEKMLEEN